MLNALFLFSKIFGQREVAKLKTSLDFQVRGPDGAPGPASPLAGGSLFPTRPRERRLRSLKAGNACGTYDVKIKQEDSHAVEVVDTRHS
jgi:hypothetical protein